MISCPNMLVRKPPVETICRKRGVSIAGCALLGAQGRSGERGSEQHRCRWLFLVSCSTSGRPMAARGTNFRSAAGLLNKRVPHSLQRAASRTGHDHRWKFRRSLGYGIRSRASPRSARSKSRVLGRLFPAQRAASSSSRSSRGTANTYHCPTTASARLYPAPLWQGGSYRPCLRWGWMPCRAATCRAYSMPSSICWREWRCLGSLRTRRSVSANMAKASSACSGKRGKDCT